ASTFASCGPTTPYGSCTRMPRSCSTSSPSPRGSSGPSRTSPSARKPRSGPGTWRTTVSSPRARIDASWPTSPAQRSRGPARRILRAIREPLTVEGHEIVVTATIGISLFPNDGHDVDTLLRNADTAMYHAKERGRDDHQFYDLSMNATAIERLTLETELHRALEEDQFRLYFQPQVDSRTGYATGAAALRRRHPPSRRLLAPEIFVALAEETGLIVPIGEWIVRHACAEAKAWNNAGHGPLRVAINVSARPFKRSDLRAMIEQTVEAAGLSPA